MCTVYMYMYTCTCIHVHVYMCVSPLHKDGPLLMGARSSPVGCPSVDSHAYMDGYMCACTQFLATYQSRPSLVPRLYPRTQTNCNAKRGKAWDISSVCGKPGPPERHLTSGHMMKYPRLYLVLRCNWSEYEGKAWERG